jgi:hypothetical protein
MSQTNSMRVLLQQATVAYLYCYCCAIRECGMPNRHNACKYAYEPALTDQCVPKSQKISNKNRKPWCFEMSVSCDVSDTLVDLPLSHTYHLQGPFLVVTTKQRDIGLVGWKDRRWTHQDKVPAAQKRKPKKQNAPAPHTPWSQAFDPDSRRYYFYNISAGITEWNEPEEGYIPDDTVQYYLTLGIAEPYVPSYEKKLTLDDSHLDLIPDVKGCGPRAHDASSPSSNTKGAADSSSLTETFRQSQIRRPQDEATSIEAGSNTLNPAAHGFGSDAARLAADDIDDCLNDIVHAVAMHDLGTDWEDNRQCDDVPDSVSLSDGGLGCKKHITIISLSSQRSCNGHALHGAEEPNHIRRVGMQQPKGDQEEGISEGSTDLENASVAQPVESKANKVGETCPREACLEGSTREELQERQGELICTENVCTTVRTAEANGTATGPTLGADRRHVMVQAEVGDGTTCLLGSCKAAEGKRQSIVGSEMAAAGGLTTQRDSGTVVPYQRARGATLAVGGGEAASDATAADVDRLTAGTAAVSADEDITRGVGPDSHGGVAAADVWNFRDTTAAAATETASERRPVLDGANLVSDVTSVLADGRRSTAGPEAAAVVAASELFAPRKKGELPPDVERYWLARYSLLSRWAEGVRVNAHSLFSITAEVIAKHQAQALSHASIIFDAFCGCGGNAIQLARVASQVCSSCKCLAYVPITGFNALWDMGLILAQSWLSDASWLGLCRSSPSTPGQCKMYECGFPNVLHIVPPEPESGGSIAESVDRRARLA